MNPSEAGKLESHTDPVSVISKLEKYVASVFLLREKRKPKQVKKWWGIIELFTSWAVRIGKGPACELGVVCSYLFWERLAQWRDQEMKQ